MAIKLGFTLKDFKDSIKNFFKVNKNATKEAKQHFYNSQKYHAKQSEKYAWSSKYSDNKLEQYHSNVFFEQKSKGRLLTKAEKEKIYKDNSKFWDDVKKTTDRVLKSGFYKN